MITSEWFHRHEVFAVCLIAFSLFVSLFLIIRMWLIYPQTSFVKKTGWSIILLVPLVGWIFYGACFCVPSRSGVEGYVATPPGNDTFTALSD